MKSLVNYTSCAHIALHEHKDRLYVRFDINSFNTSSEICHEIDAFDYTCAVGDYAFQSVTDALVEFTSENTTRKFILIVNDHRGDWSGSSGMAALETAKDSDVSVISLNIGGSQTPTATNHFIFNPPRTSNLLEYVDGCLDLIQETTQQ